MPKRKHRRRKLVSKESSPDDLKVFITEADHVRQLANSAGWQILQRDFDQYLDDISARIVYLDPKSPEFREARVLYIAVDKLLKLVEDYEENRKRSLELLDKLEHPEESVVLDVDNE